MALLLRVSLDADHQLDFIGNTRHAVLDAEIGALDGGFRVAGVDRGSGDPGLQGAGFCGLVEYYLDGHLVETAVNRRHAQIVHREVRERMHRVHDIGLWCRHCGRSCKLRNQDGFQAGCCVEVDKCVQK